MRRCRRCRQWRPAVGAGAGAVRSRPRRRCGGDRGLGAADGARNAICLLA